MSHRKKSEIYTPAKHLYFNQLWKVLIGNCEKVMGNNTAVYQVI